VIPGMHNPAIHYEECEEQYPNLHIMQIEFENISQEQEMADSIVSFSFSFNSWYFFIYLPISNSRITTPWKLK
jgi:hypothetical protein